MTKLAVLGCGNMASALVIPMAVFDKGIKTYCYTPSKTKAIDLAEKTGGSVVENISDLPQCDLYMIACKPQQFESLASELKKVINPDCIAISVLAGTTVETISKSLGITHVVRVMPNTPNLVGMGVNALYFSPGILEENQNYLSDLFGSLGECFIFNSEKEIDIISPFSGSGPAYLFEIARILADKLTSLGISKRTATLMIKATFMGSSKLMYESEESLETLRNNVTSKGGITFEALETMKKKDLSGILDSAIDAALKRTEELSKES